VVALDAELERMRHMGGAMRSRLRGAIELSFFDVLF
jgi:hypothetical protein